MRFEFATATRIIFGAGVLREVGPLAAEMGRSALVVTGEQPRPRGASPGCSDGVRRQACSVLRTGRAND